MYHFVYMSEGAVFRIDNCLLINHLMEKNDPFFEDIIFLSGLAPGGRSNMNL